MVWGCMSAAGTGELEFIEGTMNDNMYCDILKQKMIPSLQKLFSIITTPNTLLRWQLPCCWRGRWWSGQVCLKSMIPSLRRLGRRAVLQHYNDHCLAKEAEGKGDGLAKHVSRPKPYWASVGHPRKVEECKVSNIHQLSDPVMEEWKRTPVATCEALVKPCPKGLRQCRKIMVATQNIDTSGPILTFSLKSVLISCGQRFRHYWLCIELFWGESKCTLLYKLYTYYFTLYQSVISSGVVTWKDIIKYLQKCERCTHFCDILYIIIIFTK